jgi:hypothetical protein
MNQMLCDPSKKAEIEHAAQVLNPADFLAYLLEDRSRLLQEIGQLREEIFQLQRARKLAHELIGCVEGST